MIASTAIYDDAAFQVNQVKVNKAIDNVTWRMKTVMFLSKDWEKRSEEKGTYFQQKGHSMLNQQTLGAKHS